MRNLVAWLISPILALTGFRFSKDYRWGVTMIHRAVYAVCSTVMANYYADKI